MQRAKLSRNNDTSVGVVSGDMLDSALHPLAKQSIWDNLQSVIDNFGANCAVRDSCALLVAQLGAP